MQSNATTVEDYLATLPDDRRTAITTVRDLVNEHLPDGYRESMAFGMITWSVPLERLPDTYNGQPLGYIALASQKNYMTLYLMSAYGDEETWFREEYAKSGKKLDMGKSCVRFKITRPPRARADREGGRTPLRRRLHRPLPRGQGADQVRPLARQVITMRPPL